MLVFRGGRDSTLSNNVGTYDRYKWSYFTPINGLINKWVTGVITPILGVITLVITGRGQLEHVK